MNGSYPRIRSGATTVFRISIPFVVKTLIIGLVAGYFVDLHATKYALIDSNTVLSRELTASNSLIKTNQERWVKSELEKIIALQTVNYFAGLQGSWIQELKGEDIIQYVEALNTISNQLNSIQTSEMSRLSPNSPDSALFYNLVNGDLDPNCVLEITRVTE